MWIELVPMSMAAMRMTGKVTAGLAGALLVTRTLYTGRVALDDAELANPTMNRSTSR